MALLCFGGTFNPIHHGHLICARAVAEFARIEKVLLIPTRTPPHKAAGGIAAPRHRLEMCQLAVASDPLFEISDLELGRQGPSFTFDTVQQLKQQGFKDIHWLIGTDMLAILPQWHRALELIREVRFLIMARPGWEFNWPALPKEFQNLQKQVVTAPLIEISATDIRLRIRDGRLIDYLTPKPVEEYIRSHQLYAASTADV
jgi:nicotinate-nucleotide adenylyltransferase